MNELSLQNCIQIGWFRKIHGVTGTLLLNFEPEWELSVRNTDILITLTDGLPLPWFVSPNGIRITTNSTALIDLDWIDDIKTAGKLCGNPVFIEKSKILHSAEKNEISEWIGFSICSEKGKPVGIITREENFSGNRVITVKIKNEEILVPFHPDLIKEVDFEIQRITMSLPEGLPGL
jgi:16S rRNA processing protein RimM